jgi:peptidoglycan/LPS O-acetylase OafA/YrhL
MRQRFLVLDSFRGLFAVFVVLYHMNVLNSVTSLQFFRGSWVFVEFFFVLSGFVLAHGYMNKEQLSFNKYLISRVFRIFPLHVFILLVFLVFELIKFIAYKKGVTFGVLPFTGAGAIDQIIPNLLLVHAWTTFTEPYSFNFPSWSISIEFYMYLIFFVTLVLSKYRLATWLLISSFMLILLQLKTDLPVEEVKRGLGSFFAGCLTYILYTKLPKGRLNFYVASLLEITSVVAIAYVVSSNGQHSPLLTVSIFCLTILLYSFELGLISIFLKRKAFVKLGELSYSIYMVHAAILAATIYIMMIVQKLTGVAIAPMSDGRRAMDFGNDLLNNSWALFLISITIVCAHFTHKYIERTAQLRGKRLIEKLN